MSGGEGRGSGSKSAIKDQGGGADVMAGPASRGYPAHRETTRNGGHTHERTRARAQCKLAYEVTRLNSISTV